MTVTINGAGTITGLTVANVPQVNASTQVLVGGPTTSAYAYGLQLYGTAANGSSNAFQWQYSVNTTGASLLFAKTRGASATDLTAAANGDTIGSVSFGGSDGTAIQARGGFTGFIDGAVSAGNVPTAVSITTGTTVGTTRMTIGSNGKVDIFNALKVIGNSSPPAGGTTGLGLELTNATNLGIYVGSGAPTLSAAQGSLYMRTDGSSTSTRMYINTNGSTTWTSVTTAA